MGPLGPPSSSSARVELLPGTSHALGFGPPLSSKSALVGGVRCGPVLAMPCALGFGPRGFGPH